MGTNKASVFFFRITQKWVPKSPVPCETWSSNKWLCRGIVNNGTVQEIPMDGAWLNRKVITQILAMAMTTTTVTSGSATIPKSLRPARCVTFQWRAANRGVWKHGTPRPQSHLFSLKSKVIISMNNLHFSTKPKVTYISMSQISDLVDISTFGGADSPQVSTLRLRHPNQFQ